MSGRIAVAFAAGLLFALGLALSGMTQPQNIIAFLDLKHWNPVLMFVMVGAILVYAAAFRLIMLRPKPILAATFEIPKQREITGRLIAGAAIFGIGWGLGGFCGGPAIASLVAGKPQVLIFVATMFLGMFACDMFLQFREADKPTRLPPVLTPAEPT